MPFKQGNISRKTFGFSPKPPSHTSRVSLRLPCCDRSSAITHPRGMVLPSSDLSPVWIFQRSFARTEGDSSHPPRPKISFFFKIPDQGEYASGVKTSACVGGKSCVFAYLHRLTNNTTFPSPTLTSLPSHKVPSSPITPILLTLPSPYVTLQPCSQNDPRAKRDPAPAL